MLRKPPGGIDPVNERFTGSGNRYRSEGHDRADLASGAWEWRLLGKHIPLSQGVRT
jgi:hypothetical protein